MATLLQAAWMGRNRQRELTANLQTALGLEIRADDPILSPLHDVLISQYAAIELVLTAIHDEAERRQL